MPKTKATRFKVSKDWTPGQYQSDVSGLVVIAIREKPTRCGREDCHPDCNGMAWWVRTLGAQRVHEAMKKRGGYYKGPRTPWNNMANKVCRPYLEPA